MPNPDISQSESAWNAHFGQLKLSREALLPAYCDASCRLYAKICSLIPGDAKRIVTIGGGDGIFSRSELPILRRHLGENTNLNITETDASPAIFKARAIADQVYQLKAEQLTERLQPRKTHLLIGEDVIQHIADTNSFARCTKEILSLQGAFVHPFFNIYAIDDYSPERGKRIVNATDIDSIIEESVNSYAHYVGRLHEPAKVHGLKFATIMIKGKAIVTAKEFEQYRATTSFPPGVAIGSVSNYFGAMHGLPPEFPTPNVELSYLNLALIVTKKAETLRKILEHLAGQEFVDLEHLPPNPEFKNINF